MKKPKKAKSSSKKAAPGQKIITGVCRSSYMFLTELQEDDNGTRKCRTGILIKKKDKKTIKAIKKAIQAAAEKKFGGDVKVKGKKFGYPLRDADEEMEDGTIEHNKDMVGHYFINATAYKLPGLVNKYNETIEDTEEREDVLVSGYFFRFSLSFRGYDNESKGVRTILNNLMFTKEGDRLDGGSSADEDFKDFAEDDDDDDDE